MDIASIITLLGLIVPIASAIASGLNEIARNSKEVSKPLAVSQVILNTLAINVDKVKQATILLKGKK